MDNNLYFTQHYKIPKEELPTVGGIIAKVERDDLIEEAVRFYITNKLKK